VQLYSTHVVGCFGDQYGTGTLCDTRLHSNTGHRHEELAYPKKTAKVGRRPPNKHTETLFLNFKGLQESIPINLFRQPT
jgi:hypothetical protein